MISKSSEKGQVMLITVLALGGMFLGATAIGGLLMTYQIRQSSDVTNSTKAIMAADAGIEWELYKLSTDKPNYPLAVPFSNGASVKTECKKLPDESSCAYNSGIGSVSIKSTGNSSKIYRALQMILMEE